MKTISKIAIGATVVLFLAATLQPAEAACASPRLLNNGGAVLVSNPTWGGSGGTRTCEYLYGCFASESTPPISASFSGAFWGFDTTTGLSVSDPEIGLGIDNGGWTSANWTKARVADFGQPYYYPAFISLDDGTNGVSGLAPNWSFPVDGCPNDIDPDSCSCILVTDQWDGIGYYFVDSAITDAIGNFIFDGFPVDSADRPTMALAPTPVPAVTMSERDPTTADVTLMVSVADIAQGGADYRDTGCDCALGFMVYSRVVDRAALAPVDRSISGGGWIPALAATGGAQAVNAFGAPASVLVDCDPAVQQDMYLATVIVDANGFLTDNVSANSFRVECGANLADPNRTDRDPGRSSDAPRGRGNNRGQRDR